MTTRFSLSELAEMLHTTVEVVRSAVDELAAKGELTAESFEYGERNWRIAPSDTKRIQEWMEARQAVGHEPGNPRRRVVRKHVVAPADE